MDKTAPDINPRNREIWEDLVHRSALVLGILTILLPVFMYRRRSKERLSERSRPSSGLTSWPGMFLSALGYLGFGIAAWRPLPFEFFNRNRQMCTTLGCLLYFPGLALYWWGIRTLGDLFRPSTSRRAELYADHELRTSGPYALLRHPMYLGVLLAGGGAFLIFRTWTMAFYAISSLVVIARACREETALAEKFGAAWEAYRDRVPGWLPVNLFRSII